MVRKYLDFEVTKESWNKYSLRDGTKFKVRSILQSVWIEQEGKQVKHSVDVTQLQVWLCHPDIQGTPDTTTYTPKQLEAHIEVEHCNYATIQYEPSEYILDDGSRIILHDTLVQIARTSLYDANGDRHYLVKSRGQMTIEHPKT